MEAKIYRYLEVKIITELKMLDGINIMDSFNLIQMPVLELVSLVVDLSTSPLLYSITQGLMLDSSLNLECKALIKNSKSPLYLMKRIKLSRIFIKN